MGYTLIERVKNWLCRAFGHTVLIDAADNHLCRRCKRLLSTPYSRSQPND